MVLEPSLALFGGHRLELLELFLEFRVVLEEFRALLGRGDVAVGALHELLAEFRVVLEPSLALFRGHRLQLLELFLHFGVALQEFFARLGSRCLVGRGFLRGVGALGRSLGSREEGGQGEDEGEAGEGEWHGDGGWGMGDGVGLIYLTLGLVRSCGSRAELARGRVDKGYSQKSTEYGLQSTEG